MTKLNIGKQATSTFDGLITKIYELQKLIDQGKFKGEKLITAKRNLSWYKSDLKHDLRGRRNSVKSRSKAKRSR
jgi:hypothetical protein